MRNLLAGLVGLIALFIIYSCQKEVSQEYGTSASGTLKGNTGDCLPKLVGGSYIAGKPLNDSNFLEVTVDVLTPGPYAIATDSVNGFIFKASGIFASTGTNTIRLKGAGVPVNSGINNFTVVFDSSYCKVAITVLPVGSTGGAAVFSLQGAPTACAAFALGGNFFKDTTLNGTQTVTVNVNVTTVGNYTITTDTQNGYFFATTGTFGATGPATVVLTGVGKPAATGTNNFTVTAGSSNCTFSVAVTAPTTNPTTGPCGATAQGTYTAGTALAAGNTIVVSHTYAAAGPYTVSTGAAVNGFAFGPATVNATAGTPTNITLTGAGTPTAAGTNTFTINFGDGQTCTFTVTVAPGAPPVVNNDYFPTTANSYWTYSDGPGATDTFKMANSGPSAVYSSNTYQRFVYTYGGSPYYEEFYRKDASGNYFQSEDTAGYGPDLKFSVPRLEYQFLKNTLTTGQTWNTDINAILTDSSGTQFPVVLRYKYTCTNANASLTVNGKNFTNVYVVEFMPQFVVGTTIIDAFDDPVTAYYVKGVGRIRVAYDPTDREDIRYWQVN